LFFIVFTISFIVRLAFVLFYPAGSLAGGDPTAFWSFAQGVASGQGFRSSFEPWLADRPPLYSYFLALIFTIFGESKTTVFILQALIGAFSAALLFLVADRIMDQNRALVAGLVCGVFPHFLLFTKQILTEPLYISLLVSLMAVLVLFQWEPQGKFNLRIILQAILAGGVAGLLILVRREALLISALLILLVIVYRVRSPRSLPILGVILLTAFLVITPWLVRNANLLGKPALSSSGGWNFMVGNNPDARGGYTPPPKIWQAEFTGLGELERDQKARELALGWIRSNPLEATRLAFRKLWVLYSPGRNPVTDLADLVLLGLIVSAFFRLKKGNGDKSLLLILSITPLVVTTLIGIVFVGGWRYRLSIYPGLILLASYGIPERVVSWIQQLSVQWKNRKTSTAQ
jgi:4-amino-4-deoxy-L-arabinose transferase-like glycosyltransferase